MKERKYKCGYNHCLHQSEKVLASDAILLGDKRYHADCAEIKRRIQDCASLFLSYDREKSEYPIVLRALNTLVFKYRVPVDFILNNIATSENYYRDKSPQILYGIKKLYWEKSR